MVDETIRERLRREQRDPSRRQAMLDLYASGDPTGDADRFFASVEFAETQAVLHDAHVGAIVLDVGAGTGAASYAFAAGGAAKVIALEPEPGEFGRQAIADAARGLPIEAVAGVGELIPLQDASVDVVYGRQVLHHAADLPRLAAEVARVLRPAGAAFFAREPVVGSERQRKAWMAQHVWLYPGERPYLLREYHEAFSAAGLRVVRDFGTWELVVNAFPIARSQEEIRGYGRARLRARFGAAGDAVGRLPGTGRVVRAVSQWKLPNESYSFLLNRPGGPSEVPNR